MVKFQNECIYNVKTDGLSIILDHDNSFVIISKMVHYTYSRKGIFPFYEVASFSGMISLFQARAIVGFWDKFAFKASTDKPRINHNKN